MSVNGKAVMLDRDLADRCGAIAGERGSTVQGVASLLLRAAFQAADGQEGYMDSLIFPALRKRGPRAKPPAPPAPAPEAPAPAADAAPLV